MNVGPMDRGMAPGGPATAQSQAAGVIPAADEYLTRCLHLGMAAQAEIRIRLREHLRVHGAVRVVANRASLAHRRMLE